MLFVLACIDTDENRKKIVKVVIVPHNRVGVTGDQPVRVEGLPHSEPAAPERVQLPYLTAEQIQELLRIHGNSEEPRAKY
jgi:hypothetical protein